jgi:glyoxylase-like metal-dependent hydrolase (beta-lactamase superfamily II)
VPQRKGNGRIVGVAQSPGPVKELVVRVELDDPERGWTTPGAYEVRPGLYRIPLPLPSDALKAVNVYAIRDGDGLVLVDSGWSIGEARTALERALGVLDHDLSDVHRFLITHVHRDHYTLAVWVRREFGSRISIGIGERASLDEAAVSARPGWTAMVTKLRRCGASSLTEQLATLREEHDPADWEGPDDWLDPPSDVGLRDRTLQAIPTPGHTQGHVVFVDQSWNAMFAGDHVLPHITPSIGLESGVAHSPLRDYLDSLRLVRGMPDRILLPAHGPVSPSVHARVDQLLEHHAERLDTMAGAVAKGSGTAFEVAANMTWTRRRRKLDELDLFNRCLAIFETEAHLVVLAHQGKLRCTEVDGTRHYQL